MVMVKQEDGASHRIPIAGREIYYVLYNYLVRGEHRYTIRTLSPTQQCSWDSGSELVTNLLKRVDVKQQATTRIKSEPP